MPFIKTEPMPDEPIYIVHFEGKVTGDDVKTAYLATNEYWTEHLRTTGMHVIIRLDRVDSNFLGTLEALRSSAEMEQMLKHVAPYLHQYVVGSDSQSVLYSESRQLPQFGGRPVPMFHHLEDALEAARLSIRNQLAAAVDSTPSQTIS